MPPSLALLSPDHDLDARVRAILGAGDTDLRRWREGYADLDPARIAAEIADDGIDVVCLGPELDQETALALATAFDLDHPRTCVVLLPKEPTPELWDQALRVGVRGVVAPDAPDEELRDVLTAALDAAARRRHAVVAAEPPRRSRVIVVVSPKGGAGKTVMAVNLAVNLARVHPGEVALLDLDLQFGDVASGLQLAPEHSLADVARSASLLDATSLKVFLAEHASGLWVLPAPDLPAEADSITAEDSGQAVRLLATEFPIVIVDTGAGLDEHTLAALELATDILLVSTMDVSSIRSLRKELDVLDALTLTSARRHLVLNRADSKVGLNPRDVETVLGMSVDLAVPSSRAVPVAVNQGVPLSESDPRAPVSRQLEQLATHFIPRPTATASVRLPWKRDAR